MTAVHAALGAAEFRQNPLNRSGASASPFTTFVVVPRARLGDLAMAKQKPPSEEKPWSTMDLVDLRHAIEQGHVDEKHVAAEIGEVLAGKAMGRSSDAMITTYKSLGHVAQDIRLIDTVYNRLGQSAHVVYVPW